MISAVGNIINLACAALLILAAIGDREVLQALLAYASPVPEPSIEATDSGSLTSRADARGHYLVTAEVDGKPTPERAALCCRGRTRIASTCAATS